MSEKFDQFISELDQLCRKHDVTVTSSMYDQPAVWDGYDVGDIWVILDIDHIVPKSLFDMSDEAQLKKAWCISNLRLIEARENLRKVRKNIYLI